MTFTNIRFEEEYKNRVVDEYIELQKKASALNKFLMTSPEKADDLLFLQFDVMMPYLSVLKARIHKWLV